MAAKLPDLGDSCVLFKNFGKCMYGVTCRFSGAHLGEDYRNVVNVDLVKQWEGKLTVKNGLSKELQQQLRKRKVAFEKSNRYLRCLGKPSHAATGGNNMTNCSLSKGSAEVAKEEGLGVVGVLEREEPALGGSCPPVDSPVKSAGAITDEDIIKLRPCEKKKVLITIFQALKQFLVKGHSSNSYYLGTFLFIYFLKNELKLETPIILMPAIYIITVQASHT